MRDGLDELDALDDGCEPEPLPSDPWAAALALARMGADDDLLVGVLVTDFGMAEPDALRLVEERHGLLLHARRAGQADDLRRVRGVVTQDPGSAPAVKLLSLVLANTVGWTTAGVDAEMRRARRALEKLTPAQRAEAIAAATRDDP